MIFTCSSTEIASDIRSVARCLKPTDCLLMRFPFEGFVSLKSRRICEQTDVSLIHDPFFRWGELCGTSERRGVSIHKFGLVFSVAASSRKHHSDPGITNTKMAMSTQDYLFFPSSSTQYSGLRWVDEFPPSSKNF